MSIFQDVVVFSENCTSAVTNISNIGEDKAFTVTLRFKEGGQDAVNPTPALVIGAAYVLDRNGGYKEGESVKAYVKVMQKEGDEESYTKRSHRYHNEVPLYVYQDVGFIRQLFDRADDDVKRVY